MIKAKMNNAFLHLLIGYPVFVGVAAAFICAGVRMTLVPSDRKRCDWFLGAAALALPANILSENTALFLSRLRPFKLDEYIFQIDGLLGLQPSFSIGRFVTHHIGLEIVSNMAYNILPCAVLAVFGLYLWQRSENETLTVVRAFVLNLFVAIPIYLLMPACGPAFAFAGFPFIQPDHLAAQPIILHAPPNCVPSVHMSTALLIMWFVRQWRIPLLISVVYLTLIVVATLGSGQHYLFDLIVAVPYTLFILRIAPYEWKRARRITIKGVFCGEGGTVVQEAHD
jgi:hypothetical protein